MNSSTQPAYHSPVQGSIELIIGPMFSGKTTELMRRITRHRLARHSCLVIKFKLDTRYSFDKLSSHDRQMCPAIACSRLSEAEDHLKDVQVIGIDEGQFYPDLLQFCETQANAGRIVIISALDGDFQRKRFNDVVDLIPMAESVVKLTAVCSVCGDSASFSKRIALSSKQQLIGGMESYQAVCRRCYFDGHLQSSNSKQSCPIGMANECTDSPLEENPLSPPQVPV
ncbi:putative Thymidine kinase [Blattamonas nauphoetae]|uniref:Thymidine kinase n=1 Tax=Blattamonas nauphoetae TaxID=2049346 RepID=A0ABQ9XEG6_9EUKA|nr:putative Thymidine kinase [Blattamonas nauphoetae]